MDLVRSTTTQTKVFPIRFTTTRMEKITMRITSVYDILSAAPWIRAITNSCCLFSLRVPGTRRVTIFTFQLKLLTLDCWNLQRISQERFFNCKHWTRRWNCFRFPSEQYYNFSHKLSWLVQHFLVSISKIRKTTERKWKSERCKYLATNQIPSFHCIWLLGEKMMFLPQSLFYERLDQNFTGNVPFMANT